MSTTEDTTRPQTDEEIYVRNTKHQFEIVAEKLERVAQRVRAHAANLDNPRTSAVGVAADAVDTFTQGVGGIGSFLWGIVHNAEHLDRVRREQSTGGGQDG